MTALTLIYLAGVLIAFTINVVMFTTNEKGIDTWEMDISARVLTIVMSLIGAFLSWFFILFLVFARKNYYLARQFRNYFDNYKMHD